MLSGHHAWRAHAHQSALQETAAHHLAPLQCYWGQAALQLVVMLAQALVQLLLAQVVLACAGRAAVDVERWRLLR